MVAGCQPSRSVALLGPVRVIASVSASSPAVRRRWRSRRTRSRHARRQCGDAESGRFLRSGGSRTRAAVSSPRRRTRPAGGLATSQHFPQNHTRFSKPRRRHRPSIRGLWRQARLNAIAGLFKVTDRVYQFRGYDISNMTIVEGDIGPDRHRSAADGGRGAAAWNSHFQHRPKKPVVRSSIRIRMPTISAA